MARNYKYYNFNRVYGSNAALMMVAGGRGIGKTFGAKEKVINAALKGKQFILLRRFKTELKTAKNTFFDDLKAQGKFPKWDFRIQGDEAQAAHESSRGEEKRNWKTIGFFYALTTQSNIRGSSFPKVHTIIFDEFIIEKGVLNYLPDEYIKFLNFYSTVDRGQDRVRVLLLANSVSIMNPYFLANDIIPDQIGEFAVIKDGFICVHFPDSEEYKEEFKKSRFGSYIHKHVESYADYASNNKFADNHDLNLGKRPPEAIYRFTLETPDATFSLWKKSEEWYCEQDLPKDTQQRNFTLIPANASRNKVLLERRDELMKILRAAYKQGRVTFDNQQTRNGFINVGK